MAEHTCMDKLEANTNKIMESIKKSHARSEALFEQIMAKLETLLQRHNLSLSSLHGAANSPSDTLRQPVQSHFITTLPKEIDAADSGQDASESLNVVLTVPNEFSSSSSIGKKPLMIESVTPTMAESVTPTSYFHGETLDLQETATKSMIAITKSFGSTSLADGNNFRFDLVRQLEAIFELRLSRKPQIRTTFLPCDALDQLSSASLSSILCFQCPSNRMPRVFELGDFRSIAVNLPRLFMRFSMDVPPPPPKPPDLTFCEMENPPPPPEPPDLSCFMVALTLRPPMKPPDRGHCSGNNEKKVASVQSLQTVIPCDVWESDSRNGYQRDPLPKKMGRIHPNSDPSWPCKKCGLYPIINPSKHFKQLKELRIRELLVEKVEEENKVWMVAWVQSLLLLPAVLTDNRMDNTIVPVSILKIIPRIVYLLLITVSQGDAVLLLLANSNYYPTVLLGAMTLDIHLKSGEVLIQHAMLSNFASELFVQMPFTQVLSLGGLVDMALILVVIFSLAFLVLSIQTLGFGKFIQLNAVEDSDYVVPCLSAELESMIWADLLIAKHMKLCCLNKRFMNLMMSGEMYRIREVIGFKETSVFMLASVERNWCVFEGHFMSCKKPPIIQSGYNFVWGHNGSFSVGPQLMFSFRISLFTS